MSSRDESKPLWTHPSQRVWPQERKWKTCSLFRRCCPVGGPRCHAAVTGVAVHVQAAGAGSSPHTRCSQLAASPESLLQGWAWHHHVPQKQLPRALSSHNLSNFPTYQPSRCGPSEMWACGWTCSSWVNLHVGELAAHAPSLPLMVLRLCHLSPPLSPPIVTLNASPCMPAIVLYYCSFQGSTVRLEMLSSLFVCLFFICYLCEKYYKPMTAQCYIAAGSQHTRPYP